MKKKKLKPAVIKPTLTNKIIKEKFDALPKFIGISVFDDGRPELYDKNELTFWDHQISYKYLQTKKEADAYKKYHREWFGNPRSWKFIAVLKVNYKELV